MQTQMAVAAGINKLLEQHPLPEGQYSTWVDSINEVREKFPMWYPEKEDVIVPQWAIQVLHYSSHPASYHHCLTCQIS